MKREVDIAAIKDNHRALAKHLNEKALELIGGILDKHMAVVLEELRAQVVTLARVRGLRDSIIRSPLPVGEPAESVLLGRLQVADELTAILEGDSK